MATAYYAVPLAVWKELLDRLNYLSAEDVEILPARGLCLVLAPTRQEAVYVAGAMLYQ